MEVEYIEELLLPITKSERLELVEIKKAGSSSRQVIKIFLDKDGGITVEECANVSRQLSAILDVECEEENYVLEVSSPGLDRPLKNKKDFLRALGKAVLIDYHNNEGEKKECRGIVIDSGEKYVKIRDERDNSLNTISYNDILKAILDIRF